jgi:hypothetical protein
VPAGAGQSLACDGNRTAFIGRPVSVLLILSIVLQIHFQNCLSSVLIRITVRCRKRVTPRGEHLNFTEFRMRSIAREITCLISKYLFLAK